MGQKAKNAGKKQSKICNKLASHKWETLNTENDRKFKRKYGMTKQEIVDDAMDKCEVNKQGYYSPFDYMNNLFKDRKALRQNISPQFMIDKDFELP